MKYLVDPDSHWDADLDPEGKKIEINFVHD